MRKEMNWNHESDDGESEGDTTWYSRKWFSDQYQLENKLL